MMFMTKIVVDWQLVILVNQLQLIDDALSSPKNLTDSLLVAVHASLGLEAVDVLIDDEAASVE